MSLLPPPCRGGVWSKVLSSRPCGYESPWTRMFLMSLFGFQVSSPTVRAVACDGMRPRSRRSPMRAVYAFRFACMHPYASGDAYIFSFRFGLVPTFRGGLRTCMHCMHHSLIEDSRKGKETPYIDAYNAYKRKEFYLSLYI